MIFAMINSDKETQVSLAGVSALPEPETPVTTSMVEALHFRRGFHYIAVQVVI